MMRWLVRLIDLMSSIASKFSRQKNSGEGAADEVTSSVSPKNKKKSRQSKEDKEQANIYPLF
jgi:hypothetical protein